jgi:hypothetical protein
LVRVETIVAYRWWTKWGSEKLKEAHSLEKLLDLGSIQDDLSPSVDEPPSVRKSRRSASGKLPWTCARHNHVLQVAHMTSMARIGLVRTDEHIVVRIVRPHTNSKYLNRHPAGTGLKVHLLRETTLMYNGWPEAVGVRRNSRRWRRDSPL